MRKDALRAHHYYHIYNRGMDQENIFFERENWLFFLRRLRHYFALVDVLAYCLMPNHYHLLVYLRSDKFSHKVMHPFTVSYTKAINKQRDRSGPLFLGPFKACHVDGDEYLLHLSRYIHLNPVTAGLVDSPLEWEFSSYRDYLGLRTGTLPKADLILDLFPNPQAYDEFVCSGIDPQVGLLDGLLMD